MEKIVWESYEKATTEKQAEMPSRLEKLQYCRLLKAESTSSGVKK